MTRPTVLVIGAGIGGIAAAARLARHGYAVTVLEKNPTPGGRVGQIIRDGHRFDTGPTLFLMPEIFEETYAALGEHLHHHLDLRRIDPTYRIHFADGEQLALTSDMNALRSQLEAIEPGSFGHLLRYLAEGNRHYRMSLENFIGRNFEGLMQYFSLRNLPLLFRMKALVKHYDNISKYFRHPRLRAAFTFQNMYLGLSPYDAPATYSLLQYTELVDGIWLPKGGMYQVVKSLYSIAQALGVQFEFDAPVQQITIEGRRATGLRLADGRHLAGDIIVANADLPYTYQHLLDDPKEANHLDRLKYTSSAIMFYWGVNQEVRQLGTHNIFLADDYRASFDRIFEDKALPDDPSFYIHAPARTDPDAAPQGQDTLAVLVPVGHLDRSLDQPWSGLIARARRTVFGRLAKLGVPDLESHLKFEISYTPVDWQRLYNLAKGAAFGLSHNFTQVGYLRPGNRHRKYKNLFFVGASTHPGTGVPIVLLSARLTTRRILQESGHSHAPATGQVLSGTRQPGMAFSEKALPDS